MIEQIVAKTIEQHSCLRDIGRAHISAGVTPYKAALSMPGFSNTTAKTGTFATIVSLLSAIVAPTNLNAADNTAQSDHRYPDSMTASHTLPSDISDWDLSKVQLSNYIDVERARAETNAKQFRNRPMSAWIPQEISLSLRFVEPIIHLDDLGIRTPKILETIGKALDPGAPANGGAGDFSIPIPAIDLGYYLGDRTVMNLRFTYAETDYCDQADVLSGLFKVKYEFSGSATSVGLGFQHFLTALDSNNINLGLECRADIYYGDLYVKVGLPVLNDFDWQGLGYGAYAGLVLRVPLQEIIGNRASLQIDAGCEVARVGFAELNGHPNLSVAVVLPVGQSRLANK